MASVYDWVTLIIFAGLIVLFLQRSTGEQADDVPLPYYLLAGGGCAVTNYVGNHGSQVLAILCILATLGFILFFLNPFKPTASS